MRVKLDEQNRRIFTPTPHAIVGWCKRYNARSSLERIFSPFDQGDRFEHHYIRGHNNSKMRAVLAAAVMIAVALGLVRSGRQQQMCSLVRSVAVLIYGGLPTVRSLPFKSSTLRR